MLELVFLCLVAGMSFEIKFSVLALQMWRNCCWMDYRPGRFACSLSCDIYNEWTLQKGFSCMLWIFSMLCSCLTYSFCNNSCQKKKKKPSRQKKTNRTFLLGFHLHLSVLKIVSKVQREVISVVVLEVVKQYGKCLHTSSNYEGNVQ